MERSDWETNWNSLSIDDVERLFHDYPGRWWIAGGWAIDLFVDGVGRKHADVDIEVLRSETHLMHGALPGWQIFACQVPGKEPLHLWEAGEPLPPEVHDAWCRPTPESPWAMQFMVMDDDGDEWIYRRDAAIRGRIDQLTVRRRGLPLLTPELQLLYKSKRRLQKDEFDFASALPKLDPTQRTWLIEALTISDPGNPWLERLLAEDHAS